MRDYLTTKAPWWLLVLIHGGGFWILNFIGSVLAPSWWPLGRFGGVIAAALFGIFWSTLTVGARARRGAEKIDDN